MLHGANVFHRSLAPTSDDRDLEEWTAVLAMCVLGRKTISRGARN
ncbi:hypothetical protein MAUB1S_03353 [Mycolicibacterium aubagnense]